MPKQYQTFRLLTYKVNRPLSDDEIRDHLPQDRASPSAPWFQLTVIRMNSTFLECVDKFYPLRGLLTIGGFVFLFIPVFTLGMIIYFFVLLNSSNSPDKMLSIPNLLGLFGFFIFFISSCVVTFYTFQSECFRYTHYPTRFNRKTRMVHVFRPNGSVSSIPWDKVYFTLGYQGAGYWEVIGHVLSEDGKMVLDTFPLSTREIRNPDTLLYQHWEFVRRYMEEGPEKLVDQVGIVMPIDNKKETYLIGCKRLFAPIPVLAWPIVFPALFCCTIGRWIAMRTCKLPRWPQYVIDESTIDPDDPYIRDEDHLGDFETMKRMSDEWKNR